ncbi:MAG TPA: hemolysin III family protein [Acidocella sp.]|nr:hemolysin III family protein [Acidocella sp.]
MAVQKDKQAEFFCFQDYSPAERMADRVVHYIGVSLGLAAAMWLLVQAVHHGGTILVLSITLYVFGLVGMLGSSAAYQLQQPSLLKERLRRLDRAMIFVMIAGTYTPISANVLIGRGGIWLCVVIWSLAAAGIFMTLRYPRRFERAMLALYLAMGWMLLVLMHYCFALLQPVVLALIFAGGIAYSVGAALHTYSKIKFYNPIWHTLILIAASCQYLATYLQLFRVP